MTTVLVFFASVLVSSLAGFGFGRIKNAAKLAAIQSELDRASNYASTEAKNLIADIRKHL